MSARVEGMWQGRKVKYVANEVVVQARPDAGYLSEAKSFGRPSTALDSGASVIQLDSGEDPVQVAAELAQDPTVLFAEPNFIDTVCGVPNDALFHLQWALTAIRAPEAWDLQYSGDRDIALAVIDSGVALDANGQLAHRDLQADRIVLGTDKKTGALPQDDNGHGTHVLGIAGAETNRQGVGMAGMERYAPIFVYRAFDAQGEGDSVTIKAAFDAACDWAAAHGRRLVINYSAAGPASVEKRQGVERAVREHHLVCAAAGNEPPYGVQAPASYASNLPAVCAVGATIQGDQLWSNSPAGAALSVVAPGAKVLSAVPRRVSNTAYQERDGTSMATALTSGLLAMMWRKGPHRSAAELVQILKDNARPLGPKERWGSGVIDAYAAMAAV